jgi:hypothetical protein
MGLCFAVPGTRFFGQSEGVLTKFYGRVAFGAAFGSANSLGQVPGSGPTQGKFLRNPF